MAKAIGVVGTRGDDHSDALARLLIARGARVVQIETDRIPESATLTWEAGRVSYDGQPLDDVGVFYVKGVSFVLPPSDTNWGVRHFPSWPERYLAARERYSLIAGTLRGLGTQGRLFVNPLESFALHHLRVHQLSLLAQQQLPTPISLATTDPQAVRDFARRHASVIYKPLAGRAATMRLSEADLSDERLKLLLDCPVLFQEEILGDEYRAYLLDGQPVAAFHIPTDGVVDAREALARCRPAELPAEIWEMCARGAKALGLIWTAADMRRTPEGRWVVFELNPTPAISFFEDLERGRILKHLAEFLLAKA